jgi:hypothetical protein
VQLRQLGDIHRNPPRLIRAEQSKLPKRAKLRKGNSAKRSKPRKVAKSAATKPTVAKAKET